jgi:hypothetical protein
VKTRQDAKTARVEARHHARDVKAQGKADSGYWSPEAVSARQATVQAGIGAAADVAGQAIGAFAGGGGGDAAPGDVTQLGDAAPGGDLAPYVDGPPAPVGLSLPVKIGLGFAVATVVGGIAYAATR